MSTADLSHVDNIDAARKRYLGKLVRSGTEYPVRIGIVTAVRTQREHLEILQAEGRPSARRAPGSETALVIVIVNGDEYGELGKSHWLHPGGIEIYGEEKT